MRIVYLGSPDEVLAPLASLHAKGEALGYKLIAVVSQPARPVGRNNSRQDPPVAAWAKANGVLCLQPESAKAPEFITAFRNLHPDIAVTAAYGQILSDEFLAVPTRATINIHPSALPKYRGATPVPAALLDGATSTSVSILFTVKRLDAGNLIVTKDFAIADDECAGGLTARLFHSSTPLLFEALSLLANPSFCGTPQQHSEATFCKKISKEVGEVDWSSSNTLIINRFRAFNPWPGTWTYLAGKRIALCGLKLAQPSMDLKEPASHKLGEVSWDGAHNCLHVATGKGSVLVSRLKPAGGREMDASAFWNGLRDKSNVQFQRAPAIL
ncbi:MAG: methionyl-tRNA formyltransferase [Proteobacteria bacterium]|nr:methionyl-tRNA formyltransferase [Pseudomonadota bacterium]